MADPLYTLAVHLRIDPGVEHSPNGIPFAQVIKSLLLPLVDKLAEFPEAKFAFSFSGDALDQIFLLGQARILERLAALDSAGQVELLLRMPGDPAAALISPRQLERQLRLAYHPLQTGIFPGRQITGVALSPYSLSPKLVELRQQYPVDYLLIDSSPADLPSGLCTALDPAAATSSTGPALSNSSEASSRRLKVLNGQLIPDFDGFLKQLHSASVGVFCYSGELSSLPLWPREGGPLATAAGIDKLLYSLCRNKALRMMLPCELQANLSPSEPDSAGKHVAQTPGRIDPLLKRHDELVRELDSFAQHNPLAGAVLQEKLRSIELKIALSEHHSAFTSLQGSPPLQDYNLWKGARRRAFSDLITAQVMLDECLYPGTDPTNGWVHHEIREPAPLHTGEIVVDTQLLRLYFDFSAGGAPSLFDYKPRKANLWHSLNSPATDQAGCILSAPFAGLYDQQQLTRGNRRTALVGGQLGKPSTPERPLITRNTPDLLGIRFRQPVAPDPDSCTFFHEYFFRSGIGAHLPNATTGWRSEFWLEGAQAKPGLLLGVNYLIELPAGDLQGEYAKPLLCVGGIGDGRYPLTTEKLILSNSVPGGLYGIRLVDGITDLIFDLRTAKPVWGIAIAPVITVDPTEPATPTTISVLILFEPTKIFGDERRGLLFCSIL